MEGRGVHSINALRSMLAAADLCCNHTPKQPHLGLRADPATSLEI